MLGRISILLQCKEWHWSIFSGNFPLLYQFCFLLPPRGLILATGFSVSCHPLYIFFFLPVCLLPAVLLCSTKSVLHSLGIPDPLLTNRGRQLLNLAGAVLYPGTGPLLPVFSLQGSFSVGVSVQTGGFLSVFSDSSWRTGSCAQFLADCTCQAGIFSSLLLGSLKYPRPLLFRESLNTQK